MTDAHARLIKAAEAVMVDAAPLVADERDVPGDNSALVRIDSLRALRNAIAAARAEQFSSETPQWAKDAVAREREECARVAETRHNAWRHSEPGEVCDDISACADIAKAIRSRSQSSESAIDDDREALVIAEMQKAALRARVEKLEEALRPFTMVMPWQGPDHWPAFGKRAGEGWPTVGDFRRARAALSGKDAGNG